MQDHKLKHMAELQLSVVSESESRRQIGAQIAAWEENLERLHCEQFRLRCYMASLQHGELPNPKVRQLNQAPSPYIPNFQGNNNSNNPNKKLNKLRMASVFSSCWTIPPSPGPLCVSLFFLFPCRFKGHVYTKENESIMRPLRGEKKKLFLFCRPRQRWERGWRYVIQEKGLSRESRRRIEIPRHSITTSRITHTHKESANNKPQNVDFGFSFLSAFRLFWGLQNSSRRQLITV